jgi:hypothetical protein
LQIRDIRNRLGRNSKRLQNIGDSIPRFDLAPGRDGSIEGVRDSPQRDGGAAAISLEDDPGATINRNCNPSNKNQEAEMS